jgi:DNA-binding response OmpR family regulator
MTNEGKRILVVEDDRHIARALAVRLRAAGFDVVEAHDGEEGFAAASRLLPDAIVADIRMPGMDGLSMIAMLRAFTATCSIPTVISSANIAETAKAHASELGVAYYIEKPYNAATLMQAINAALAGGGAPTAGRLAAGGGLA